MLKYNDQILIDHMFLINLEKRPEKLERSMEVFKKYDMDVERVNGIDAVKLGYERNEHGLLPGFRALNEVIIGILENAIKNDYKSIFIFEDDIEINEDPRPHFNDLPDNWDTFYLGCLNNCNYPKIKGTIHKVRKAFLGHAIALKSTMFQPVIDQLKKMTLSSDESIASVYSDLENYKAYCTIPGIAWQRKGYSDDYLAIVDNSEVN